MFASQAITKSRQLLVERLRGKIRRAETTGRNDDGTIVSSGSVAMDQMLPAGGYNRGTIIEWLAKRGSGADFLSLQVAKNAADEGGALVIIDHNNQFYPPAARALRINLSNLIVLRREPGASELATRNRDAAKSHLEPSSNLDDFYWAIDQSLRCSAVAAVWGCLPPFATPQIAVRWLRRFQLSAETSGCIGLFVRRHHGRKKTLGTAPTAFSSASWSEIQWQIEPQATSDNARPAIRLANSSGTTNGEAEHHTNVRCIKATLSRCRGGTVGRSVELEINTVTGNVQHARREHAKRNTRQWQTHPLPLAAQLAHPKTDRRSARA